MPYRTEPTVTAVGFGSCFSGEDNHHESSVCCDLYIIKSHNTQCAHPKTECTMEKTAVSGVSTDPTTTTSRESQQDVLKETSKVLLFLRPVGEVAGLRKTRYKLDGSKAIVEVEKFLRKTLEMSADQSIFIYCGSGFSPTPDQNLQDLFDNFQTNGELIVNYGIQEAWG
jgi:ubiquitin-like protein ATG12